MGHGLMVYRQLIFKLHMDCIYHGPSIKEIRAFPNTWR